MADIVDLNDVRRSRGGDDAAFLSCRECGSLEFAAVSRLSSDRTFIAALLCIGCDPPREMPLVAGFLQDINQVTGDGA